ncbi:biotin--[acetyl-CoA-carboxylase] ligase [Bacillus sp. ISL-40]|uniref:biotin--[acetyl-CoA-carboxylase] ligase n=1 Tax=unclassified Bacillus (in: firmicutes) TaxID=185979 RepID=UPI001BE96446|nr:MULTISPECIES: biotin--[acetyl-CoA-carboxylase] ligase [unclassified Bacillus (in: firmicutes)]MBT2701531.1 biotin--[acetyl-CoA-carboxylase] ligase [Bacillus sp. ISL-40]MBT2724411.1 biotin--[acetyl-CoA-carboxylase] ligase [Bacillus sp. ISL-46]
MQSEIRKELLDAFTTAGDTFLSGQHLAELIGCSRTAVWKHIEELRKEGFELEAVRNKGYRILKTPEKVTADEVRFGLTTNFIGRNIHYVESVESTQKLAHHFASEDAPEGTVIIAEEQLSGRGRMARKWHSPKYTGIWMSMIIRPNIPLSNAPQLTLLAAVAIVQAIEEMTDLIPEIKWPNDILINGKKVTGILTELQAEADLIHSIIIGIGINVNQKKEDFPLELQEIATSLFIEDGETVSRAELIRSIFKHFEKLYTLYLEQGFLPIKLLWEGYAGNIGKYIKARTLTNTIEGKALGITNDGVLQLEDLTGTIHHIYSADIEF